MKRYLPAERKPIQDEEVVRFHIGVLSYPFFNKQDRFVLIEFGYYDYPFHKEPNVYQENHCVFKCKRNNLSKGEDLKEKEFMGYCPYDEFIKELLILE